MKNPGWAGETGEFDLSEAEVRGTDYVGEQPLEGWPNGGVTAFPYMRSDRDPDAALFEGPHRERLQNIISRYPDKRAALLPVLNLAHEVRGHLSQESMDAVAEELEESPAAVRGVATFYTMYNKRPVGRHLIQVCTNVSCNLCGGQDVFEAFLEHTDTEPGQTSEDGEFTVIEVECLGACGFPTAVQVNSRYLENVEPGDVPDILARLKERGVDHVGAEPGAGSSGSYSGSGSGLPEGRGGEGAEGEADREGARDGEGPGTPPTTSPNTSPKPGRGGGEEGGR